MTQAEQAAIVEAMGEAEKFRIERDGDRDLTFRGWQLGEGTRGTGGSSGLAHDHTRGVVVEIYLTTGGNLVTSVYWWSRWVGEGNSSEAAVHRGPQAADDALHWLFRLSESDHLCSASKCAWEKACQIYAPLKDREMVEVE